MSIAEKARVDQQEVCVFIISGEKLTNEKRSPVK
jgi:hypothetical protein